MDDATKKKKTWNNKWTKSKKLWWVSEIMDEAGKQEKVHLEQI
jgi:hypothetical protein